METVSFQVLKTMGRWFAILMLFSQSAFSQEKINTIVPDNSIWHNGMFLFCICFFIAGLIFMLTVKVREEHKQNTRHERRLSHRRH